MKNSTGGGAGTLYVVATPIGNLGDISERAIDVLNSVDVIAAEDTRHSARLCQHFSIDTPLKAYHDYSDQAHSEAMIGQLQNGKNIALISDAGTPLISDPGYRLVKLARDADINVVPIPGACAMAAALSVAGLPSDRFCFEGFLPAKSGQRLNYLQALLEEERTMIFYEAPHRIEDSLAAMVDVFGAERDLVLAREITKTYETVLAGSAQQVLSRVQEDPNQRKGEMVVLVKGFEAKDKQIDAKVEHMMRCLLAQLPVKQAAQIGAEISGLRKKELYQWALDNKPD
ncbi:16S rRNA (cytidine(1402)-2'-O)-methyltransferase [Pseudoteredinibacter isoporae]|nr:16S rRNA (cytidine(1402)-2'-O)-methyltransferase [Pseudoteredinibacter isoporae]NHO88269.1 16S rRNA (cytidine(1402)-2'-O)-methyltransferase [Pseudoteredinibacter isoporae]NIB23400.1 16S rRNA (cytidine(1402)-2'-O)-methyltransferase [Pseudoteredinibacter isoporae]